MSQGNLAHWQPREIVADAQHQTLEQFRVTCESPYLLLIRLDDPNSELALGLANQDVRDAGGDSLGFRTQQRDPALVDTSDSKLKPVPLDLRRTQRFALPSLRPGAAQLSALLHSATCYVLPLRKRSEAAFLRSVSVGRARNHDVVLRHRTVSKFHGSFDFDDDGKLFVRDANSSNHTYVNGKQVGDRVELQSGDAVQFGSVGAHVCATDEFWRTLHA